MYLPSDEVTVAPGMLGRKRESITLLAFVLGFCIVSATCAHAQTVHRCVDSNGKVTFSDTECSGNRSTVRLQSSTIGDGGATKAKVEQAAGEKQNSVDTAMRRYRDVAGRVKKLKAALDGNEAEKQAEIESILKEQEKCRFHRIPTRRCIELDAMQQSTIDKKYHDAWMRDHRSWLDAMDEQSRAAKDVIRLTGKAPD